VIKYLNLTSKVLEERKIKEIEHSKTRREILQGFERLADTHAASQIDDLESLIKDKKLFNYHFANMKYYSVTKSSEDFKHKWLEMHCGQNIKLLDFACGNGENGIYGAICGADTVAIDISPEGIENSKTNAHKMGVSHKVDCLVMDGENMTFEENFFDLGIEYGALHHVDLEVTLKELARVLKPGSKMLCLEALRHNPLIHLYRKKTPHLRTEWEVDHILGVESFELMKKYFKDIDVKYFHLTSLALVPLRKTFLFPILLPLFDFIDRILLSSKFIGKFGWIMAVQLANPKK